MKPKLIPGIIAALLIILFVYTATNKLIDFYGFVRALNKSPLIHSYSRLIAWLVIIAETGVSALLFFDNTRRMGLYAATLLMLAFTLYVAYMILFIPHLPCSCGGIIKYMSWKQHLVFNIGFTCLAALGAFIERKNE